MIMPSLVAEVGNHRQKGQEKEEEQKSTVLGDFAPVRASLLHQHQTKTQCLLLPISCTFSTEPDTKKCLALVMATKHRHPTHIIIWRNQHSMAAGEFEF